MDSTNVTEDGSMFKLCLLAACFLGSCAACVGVMVCGDRLLTPPHADPNEKVVRSVSEHNYHLRAEIEVLRAKVAELEAGGVAVGIWKMRAELDASRRAAVKVIPLAGGEDVGPGDLIPATDVPVR